MTTWDNTVYTWQNYLTNTQSLQKPLNRGSHENFLYLLFKGSTINYLLRSWEILRLVTLSFDLLICLGLWDLCCAPLHGYRTSLWPPTRLSLSFFMRMGGASVCGGTRSFLGRLRRDQFFSVVQGGGGVPDFFNFIRGGRGNVIFFTFVRGDHLFTIVKGGEEKNGDCSSQMDGPSPRKNDTSRL